MDSRMLRSTPESGHRGGYDGAKPKKDSKIHIAVDTLGHLLALRVTPATEQDRAQVGELVEAVQEAAGESVELAYVDRGYTGDKPAEEAEATASGPGQAPGGQEELRAAAAEVGVVERSFAWAARFRRLAKDYERLPETVAGLHFVAFACLMLDRAVLRLGAGL